MNTEKVTTTDTGKNYGERISWALLIAMLTYEVFLK